MEMLTIQGLAMIALVVIVSVFLALLLFEVFKRKVLPKGPTLDDLGEVILMQRPIDYRPYKRLASLRQEVDRQMDQAPQNEAERTENQERLRDKVG
jgi:hypothetical protein